MCWLINEQRRRSTAGLELFVVDISFRIVCIDPVDMGRLISGRWIISQQLDDGVQETSGNELDGGEGKSDISKRTLPDKSYHAPTGNCRQPCNSYRIHDYRCEKLYLRFSSTECDETVVFVDSSPLSMNISGSHTRRAWGHHKRSSP